MIDRDIEKSFRDWRGIRGGHPIPHTRNHTISWIFVVCYSLRETLQPHLIDESHIPRNVY
jgi:hypothetical protein